MNAKKFYSWISFLLLVSFVLVGCGEDAGVETHPPKDSDAPIHVEGPGNVPTEALTEASSFTPSRFPKIYEDNTAILFVRDASDSVGKCANTTDKGNYALRQQIPEYTIEMLALLYPTSEYPKIGVLEANKKNFSSESSDDEYQGFLFDGFQSPKDFAASSSSWRSDLRDEPTFEGGEYYVELLSEILSYKDTMFEHLSVVFLTDGFYAQHKLNGDDTQEKEDIQNKLDELAEKNIEFLFIPISCPTHTELYDVKHHKIWREMIRDAYKSNYFEKYNDQYDDDYFFDGVIIEQVLPEIFEKSEVFSSFLENHQYTGWLQNGEVIGHNTSDTDKLIRNGAHLFNFHTLSFAHKNNYEIQVEGLEKDTSYKPYPYPLFSPTVGGDTDNYHYVLEDYGERLFSDAGCDVKAEWNLRQAVPGFAFFWGEFIPFAFEFDVQAEVDEDDVDVSVDFLTGYGAALEDRKKCFNFQWALYNGNDRSIAEKLAEGKISFDQGEISFDEGKTMLELEVSYFDEEPLYLDPQIMCANRPSLRIDGNGDENMIALNLPPMIVDNKIQDNKLQFRFLDESDHVEFYAVTEMSNEQIEELQQGDSVEDTVKHDNEPSYDGCKEHYQLRLMDDTELSDDGVAVMVNEGDQDNLWIYDIDLLSDSKSKKIYKANGYKWLDIIFDEESRNMRCDLSSDEYECKPLSEFECGG